MLNHRPKTTTVSLQTMFSCLTKIPKKTCALYTCTSRSAQKKTCDSACLECDGQSLGLECDGHAREALARWLIDCGGLVADWAGQQGG